MEWIPQRQWGGKTIECQFSMAKLILQVLGYLYIIIIIFNV